MTLEAVRPASSDDAARCAELLNRAVAEVRASRGGDLLADLGDGRHRPSTVPLDAPALERWRAAADRRLVVGEFGGSVVGLAGAVVEQQGPPGRASIEWCYVEPAARGVGVGGALVADLVAWATGEGCRHLEARALPGDRGTKQLYETSGFKARLLVMHRTLPG